MVIDFYRSYATQLQEIGINSRKEQAHEKVNKITNTPKS
jgi:hypothetical protein